MLWPIPCQLCSAYYLYLTCQLCSGYIYTSKLWLIKCQLSSGYYLYLTCQDMSAMLYVLAIYITCQLCCVASKKDGYHLLQFEQLLYAEGLHIFGQVIRNVATKTMTAPWLELLGTTKTDQGLATHTVLKFSVKDASNVKEWRVVLLRLLSESESDNRTTSLRPL